LNQLTAQGQDLIKQFEGFQPKPYLDPAGIPSVGYGHVILPGESFTQITRDQGVALMLADIAMKHARWVADYVKVPLNDNQFSALVSLVYNVGVTPLTHTLGTLLNAGNYDMAADHFGDWVYAKVDGTEQILPGLVKRRAAEKALFLEPMTA
jgi:lysozyme